MVDFSTKATFNAEVSQRSLRQSRRTLESELASDPLDVDAQADRKPGSAMGGGGPLDAGGPSSGRSTFVQETLQLDTIRNELLGGILDAIEQGNFAEAQSAGAGGGGGGGGILPIPSAGAGSMLRGSVGLGAGGLAAAGGAAAGALTLGSWQLNREDGLMSNQEIGRLAGPGSPGALSSALSPASSMGLSTGMRLGSVLAPGAMDALGIEEEFDRGLEGLKSWAWPSLPEFDWPTLPKFSWPSLPSFSWPDLPTWGWPPLPPWEWPSLPEFDWPTLPTWEWPKIKAPDWLDLLGGGGSGGNGPGGSGTGGGIWGGVSDFVTRNGPALQAPGNSTRSNRAADRQGGNVTVEHSPTFEISDLSDLRREQERNRQDLQKKLDDLKRSIGDTWS